MTGTVLFGGGGLFLGGLGYNVYKGVKDHEEAGRLYRAAHPHLLKTEPATVLSHKHKAKHSYITYVDVNPVILERVSVPERFSLVLEQERPAVVNGKKTEVEVTETDQVTQEVYDSHPDGSTIVIADAEANK